MKSTLTIARHFVVAAAAALVVAGCGDKAVDSPQSSQDQVIGATSFVSTPAGLLAKEGLKADARNFELTLAIEEGGTAMLVAYGDEKLADGVNVSFTRMGTAIVVRINGMVPVPFNAAVGADLTVRVDVHNGEGGRAHVVVWNSATIAEANEVQNDPLTAVQGQSDKWGVTLTKAVLKAANVGDAQHAD